MEEEVELLVIELELVLELVLVLDEDREVVDELEELSISLDVQAASEKTRTREITKINAFFIRILRFVCSVGLTIKVNNRVISNHTDFALIVCRCEANHECTARSKFYKKADANPIYVASACPFFEKTRRAGRDSHKTRLKDRAVIPHSFLAPFIRLLGERSAVRLRSGSPKICVLDYIVSRVSHTAGDFAI